MNGYFKHADDFYNLYLRMKQSNQPVTESTGKNDKKNFPITIIQAPITLNSNGCINVNQSIVLQKKQQENAEQYQTHQNQVNTSLNLGICNKEQEQRSRAAKNTGLNKKSPSKSGDRRSSVNRLEKYLNSKQIKTHAVDVQKRQNENLKMIPSWGVLKSNKAFNNSLSQSTFAQSKIKLS